MSVVYVLYGLVGLLGLFLVVGVSMTWAARAVARVLGLTNFQWFDARPAPASWWHWLLVRLVSMAAPLGVSIVLFWGSLYVGGVPNFTGTRVEVQDGAALAAGMRTGDRVLRVGSEPIGDFEELREAVKRSSGVVAIEVERSGQRLLLNVTPRASKIGVAPLPQRDQVSLLEAGQRAIPMPFAVVRATAQELVRMTASADKPQLSGPVGIVRETSKAGQDSSSSFFTLLAVLAGYLWPFAAGVVLFDVVTGYIFRAAHPDAATSALRGYRLERLRQASLFACAGYAAFLFAMGLDAADVPFARLLLMWAMAAGIAGYPLIWVGGRELWPRPITALVVVASIFVPCLVLFGVLGLHYALGRALKAEAFRVTWLSAQPPANDIEQSRWGT